MEKVILAVDIGGSKYVAGLVDSEGRVLYKRKYKWYGFAAEQVIKDLVCAMELAAKKAAGAEIKAVGMTIPGLADPDTGMWISSSFMGIKNLPIGPIMRQHFGLPVFIENDCNACAMAELRFGRCKGVRDFFYLTVSNSIGGAVVADGAVYKGACGSAGEIGLVLVHTGERFSEGGRVPLEDCASGRGLVNTYLSLGGKKKIDGIPCDGVSIARLARDEDQIAKKAFLLEGMYLGQAIAGCCLLLDPGMVIIGGGLSLAFDLYGETLRRTVREEMGVAKAGCPGIEPTGLGYDGGLIGAAALANSAILEYNSQ